MRAITFIVYEGHAFEDLPIGKESEETAKRIMAAARSGRRFMHFSNCQEHLQDPYLTQALTNPVINGRRLGSNDASSDLSVPNEIDFSLSANVGHTYREDFEPRMRKIELAYFEEDPNERKFKDKFLHRTVTENRCLVLSAIAALFNHWANQGFPIGRNDFISYPQWAETIGGVMEAAGLGNPCLPFQSSYETGGDLKTAAMTALFRLCFKSFGDAWVTKKQIYQAIEKVTGQEDDDSSDTEALRWFGPLEDAEEARSNQSKLGRDLRIFKNRILGGIKMVIDESDVRSTRHKFRFQSLGTPQNAKIAPDLAQNLDTLDTLATSKGPMRGTTLHTQKCFRDECVKYIVPANDSSEVSKVAKVANLDAEFLALDLETYGQIKVTKRRTAKNTSSPDALDPWKGDIRLVSLADGENVQIFDLYQGPLPDEIRATIERSTLIIHNAHFDCLFLKNRLGLVLEKVFCTMTASRLLTPRRDVRHKLEAVVERYLGIKLAKEHGGSDWGAFVLTDGQLTYARDDVRHLHALEAKLASELKAAGLEAVFELEMKLIPLIVKMEDHGFAIDCAKLEELQADAGGKAVKQADSLRKAFSLPELNPNSFPQLLDAFKAVGVELKNTDEATLVVCEDPRAKMVLDYREADMLSRAIKGLLKAAGKDGRIHARFNPTGAGTGRFSSSKPNLQNIPRGILRFCFIPSGPDRVLIVADYSQIELRVAAYFAKDEVMLAAFRARKDLHRETAAAVLSKNPQEVVKADRQLAKAVNFGFEYGQQASGFRDYARTKYGIVLSLEEAARLRTRFFEKYPGLARWHRDAWQKANDGVDEAWTILRRRLCAQGDRAWDRFQVGTCYRVQGSAADVIKVGMVEVDSILPDDVYLVASVHDELIYDAPAVGAQELCEKIRATMEKAFTKLFGLDLPIEVEAKVLNSWGEK